MSRHITKSSPAEDWETSSSQAEEESSEEWNPRPTVQSGRNSVFRRGRKLAVQRGATPATQRQEALANEKEKRPATPTTIRKGNKSRKLPALSRDTYLPMSSTSGPEMNKSESEAVNFFEESQSADPQSPLLESNSVEAGSSMEWSKVTGKDWTAGAKKERSKMLSEIFEKAGVTTSAEQRRGRVLFEQKMRWPLRKMHTTNHAEWQGLGDAGRAEFNRLLRIFSEKKSIKRGVYERVRTRKQFESKLQGIKNGLQRKSRWTAKDLERVMTSDLSDRARETILKNWAELEKIDGDELWSRGKERRKIKALNDVERERKRRQKNGGLQVGGRVRKPLSE